MHLFAVCLFAFLAFSSVESASFQFRSGREVLIPLEEAIRAEEFVAELKKEADQLAIEEAVPVVVEEIVVPVESLRNVEPIVDVQEPVAVADQELVVPVNALRDAAIEVVAVPESVFKQEVRDESVKTVAAEDVVLVKSAQGVNQIVAEKVSETDDADIPYDAVLRQAAVDGESTVRPSLLQVAQNTINNLIANNPITNALNAIRNPSSADTPVVEDVQPAASAPAPAAPSSSDTTAAPARPSFVQQVQTGVANIQQQFQTALNNVQTSAAAVVNGENRPNIIQSIQSAINRPIQAIFRPNQATASDEHDAVVADDAVVAAPAPVEPAAVNVAHQEPEPVVSIVKEGIEIVSDKVDA